MMNTPERQASRRWHSLSIRTVLFLAVLFAIAPALAIIIWSGIEYGGNLKNRAIAEVQRQTNVFAEIQIQTTESTRQVLSTITALPPIKSRDFRVATTILRTVHAQNESFLNFTLVDTKGTVIASSRLAPGTVIGDRPHMAAALGTGRFSSGQYLIGVLEATPSFAFSQPVLDEAGTIVGVVNAIFKLSSYAALFERFSLPENAILGLVDRNGVRLFFYPAKDTNPIGIPIKGNVWDRMTAGGDEGVFWESGSDGVERYYGYRKLRLGPEQEPYMYVVYASPASAATEASRRVMTRNLFLMLAVAVFAFAGASALFDLTFGSSLRRIISVTASIRDGNLNARVGLHDDSPDLGRIGKALDLMAETIERRDAERAEDARKLSIALGEKGILLKEIHHRVKNNLQLIQSMILLQDDDSKFDEFKESIESRIASMALLHETLYKTENEGEADLAGYVHQLADLILQDDRDRVEASITAPEKPVFANLDKAVPFGLLVNELVTNSLKHGLSGGRHGKVEISLTQNGELVMLEVRDHGPGLPPGFSIAQSRGLGLRLADALAAQLGGELRWESGEGARFFVEFPTRVSRTT